MRTILIALFFSLAAPVAAQAQSSCDSKQTEEEYQKCIERGGNNKTYDPSDWGQGNVTTPDGQPIEIEDDIIDPLPAESRRQIRKEMAKKVYAKVGEWTPDARKQDFDYEPSAAAKADPELKAQEEAAFAAAVADYHDREQLAAENGGGAGKSDGSDQGQGGSTVSVGGEVNAPDASGQNGGGGQSRNVYDILGDLNVIGNPGASSGNDGGGNAPKPSDGPGETVEIAGDVTIGGPGASSGSQGQSGGGNGQSGAAQGGGSQAADAGASGGDTPSQPASNPGGNERNANDAFGQLNPPPESSEGEAQPQTGAQASNESDPAPSGAPAQSGGGESGPPPTPPRAIPPADPTSAQILADLFDGKEEQSDIALDAPVVDWANPDASAGQPQQTAPSGQAAAQSSAIEQAAQSISNAPQPAPQSVSETIQKAPPAQRTRAAEKEQARIAYKEQQLTSANLTDAQKAALAADIAARKAALGGSSAATTDSSASPQANARLATLSLP